MNDYANGLRALATWIDEHPELVPTNIPEIAWFHMNSKEEAEALVRALGHVVKKRYADSLLSLEHNFGDLKFRVVFSRDNICTSRVVRTEVVPEHTIPSYTREILEWDCGSLLTKDQWDEGGEA
jgi:hypothetical protein